MEVKGLSGRYAELGDSRRRGAFRSARWMPLIRSDSDGRGKICDGTQIGPSNDPMADPLTILARSTYLLH
jgi:hypothetical protein